MPFTTDHRAVPPKSEIPEAWQRHISLLTLPRGGQQAFQSLGESWLYPGMFCSVVSRRHTMLSRNTEIVKLAPGC